MKTWIYSWKSPDGLRHEGEIASPSKDEAFAALREKGIRPIRVTERIVPVVRRGLKGLRKRDWSLLAALLILVAAAVAVPAFYFFTFARPSVPPTPVSPSPRTSLADRAAIARPRHQFALPDLPLSEIFRHPSEVYLARFARPGLPVKDSAAVPPPEFADDLLDALDDPILIAADDPKPVADLKRVVAGMKEEAALLLGGGRGADGVAAYLVERQRMEEGWRLSVLERVRSNALDQSSANAQLTAMGLAPL